jgi:hypothetical protein
MMSDKNSKGIAGKQKDKDIIEYMEDIKKYSGYHTRFPIVYNPTSNNKEQTNTNLEKKEHHEKQAAKSPTEKHKAPK